MWWIVGIIILIAAISSKRFRTAVIALVIIAIAFVIHPSIGIIASIAGLIMSIRCYVFTKEGSHLKYNFRGYEDDGYTSNQTNTGRISSDIQTPSKSYSSVNDTAPQKGYSTSVSNKTSNNYYSSGSKTKEYDKYGFDQDGINKETGTKRNKRGFDKNGKNKFTGTNYDSNGYDIGWFSRTGYNKHGLDKDGYDRRGFDKNGIHKITGTKRDENGFNKNGINKVTGTKFNENYNDTTYYQPKKSQKFEDKFNEDGVNKETGTKRDKRGFDKNGINKFTGDKYDENGYDCEWYNRRGFNKHGYNREGYDRRGFDKKGIHKDTGIERDKRGFNVNGINKDTGTIYSVYHFDINGKNEFTGTKYDEEGFDMNGYNILGMDRKGYKNNVGNVNTEQKNTEKENLDRVYNIHGFDQNGFDKQGYHKFTGKIINEQGLTREEVESGVMPKQKAKESRFQKIPTNFDKKNDNITDYKNTKYDRYGFDEEGIHKNTGTRWDKEGFDVSGINIDTGTMFSIYHFDRNGINEFTGSKYDEEGFDVNGYNDKGLDRNGKGREVDDIPNENKDYDIDDGNNIQEAIIKKIASETEKLSDEIVTDQIKKELSGDVYTLDYAENILFKNKIKTENYKKSFQQLGYSIKNGYIIKREYVNFKRYLSKKIITEGVIRIDKDLVNLNYNTVADFCREFQLFKVKDGLYISWIKMAENDVDIKYINTFLDNLEDSFGSIKFFSLKNIREKINIERFDKLGFGDEFIENIIFYGKGIYTLRLNNNKLFTYVVEKPTRNDFIESEMEKYTSISLSKFTESVCELYGLDLDYEIVKYYMYGIKNIYYNSTLDKLYRTKQDFYNEID